MLIGYYGFWGIMIGIGVVGPIGAVAALEPRFLRVRGRRIAAGVATVLLCAAAASLYFFHHDVVVVTEQGDVVHAAREVAIGAATCETATGPRTVGAGAGHAWIVNDTRRDLHVIRIVYAEEPTAVPDDHVIAPHQVEAEDHRIDDLGPDDPPPDELRAEHQQHETTRLWLTW